MKNKYLNLLIVPVTILSLGLFTIGCSEAKDGARDTGEAIEDAAKDAADTIEDTVDDAADAVKDATN